MKKYLILIPVYNDWTSLFELLKNIDQEASNKNIQVSVMAINDSSTEEMLKINNNFFNLQSVKILNLINNDGHCHAIATGLKYAHQNFDFDYIIPMDGDGEDRPEELKNFFDLVDSSSPEIITANRVKRSEGPAFKACYVAHKFLTYLMTGKMIKFGNYSCLSKSAVEKILSNGSVWLSFSGSIAKNFSSIVFIESVRGTRYFGPSKMSFFRLAKHSLSISATFRETIFLRSAMQAMLFTFAAHYSSSYFLIPAMLSWIFMLFMFFLSRNDDMKKLEESSNNIKELTNLYDR